ncbi:solute carrier family 35 member F4-like [Lingula anatina]|uniref:Solute carrier family 35 member F4-like n=1 Tax=Lingula anatina TaxID=7574 RepID=A0A1S3K8V3_LINAN|nr:solute carrier family 35 member F4-like [Lingula anatina]|eukprot:XP_013418874.1 solute carrier family 35 member F4-like [Lingula anatina]
MGGNTSSGRTIPKVTVTSAASVDNSTVSATQLNNSDILQPSSAEKPRKIVCGIITTITLAVTFVGFTVLARRTFVLYTTFQAPFFLTYFCSIWPIIMFPVCIVAKWLRTRGKLPISSSWREYKAVFSEHDTYRPLSIICKCVAFSFLWVGPWYMFIRALGMISVLDVVILSATYPCFMYLFSWTLLCNTFIAFRIVAILISVTGVVIMVHGSPEGFDHASLWTWGAAMAAVSAMAGAFQKMTSSLFLDEAPLLAAYKS